MDGFVNELVDGSVAKDENPEWILLVVQTVHFLCTPTKTKLVARILYNGTVHADYSTCTHIGLTGHQSKQQKRLSTQSAPFLQRIAIAIRSMGTSKYSTKSCWCYSQSHVFITTQARHCQ